MRTIMYVIAACIVLAMTSCLGHKSEEKVLENSENLLALQVEVINGDTLMGVKTIFDTIQVVPMCGWDSIRAESKDVVRAYKSGQLCIYTASGKQLGIGAMKELVAVDSDCGLFYRATDVNNENCFYFPSSGDIIDGVTAMYIGRTVMLLQTAERWEIRSYDGKLIWQTKDLDICILRRIYAEKETIQIVELNETNIWVYDDLGNIVSRLTAADWNKAKSKFRRTAEIGSAAYGELDINYAL